MCEFIFWWLVDKWLNVFIFFNPFYTIEILYKHIESTIEPKDGIEIPKWAFVFEELENRGI